MNGDEKEEAHRPRPLSGGIWTLFSWLRKNERSSSSDSLSSVGSARTAASFDFLTPGHCNFSNTHIVLNTPQSPPTETYKKRLQDRNLRRQIDRDITLHRKYGLFREYGYDGFSLPSPTRRVIGNTVNRQNRERRATSECLQRRPAYVPGKRRAPLPPTLVTSASLPRSYKRKRPAPKPPVKNTIQENKALINNQPVRMNSNIGSNDIKASDKQLSKSNKAEKCDKKNTNGKDTKSKADKSFLKHIFENKKRHSLLETTSVRLLPSISELDKQAAEIIENNKSRKNTNEIILPNNVSNVQNSSKRYEEYGWFCTTCLRKFDSSINSCNYCSHVKRPTINVERCDIKNSSLTSSTTQTNNSLETASSSRSSIEERKMLKEILKEMKNSLPKKHKDVVVSKLVTETPTLRIGSTVQEPYKVLTPQPSRSSNIREFNKYRETENIADVATSRILPISSLLSERQSDVHKKVPKDCDFETSNILPCKEDTALENHKLNIKSKSSMTSVHAHYKADLTMDNQPKESASNMESSKVFIPDNHLKVANMLLGTKVNNTTHKTSFLKVITDKNGQTIDNTNGTYPNDTENKSNIENVMSVHSTPSNETNEKKKTTDNVQIPNEKSSGINQQEHIAGSKNDTNYNNIKCLLTSIKTNESTSEKNPLMQSKPQYIDHSATNNVVVNRVTVVTSNKEVCQESKKLGAQNVEDHVGNLSRPKISNQKITNAQFKSIFHYQPRLQTETKPISNVKSITSVKTESSLHTPLRISSLLNPLYSPKLPIIIEKRKEVDVNNQLQNELQINADGIKQTNFEKTENKQSLEKVTPGSTFTSSSEITTTHLSEVSVPQKKEALKVELINKNKTSQALLKEPIALPSTSGCSSGDTSNTNIHIDQYDLRRNLINQLEQSIAKGDEIAAAEAAAKLAKLRLSCSVLSFSSQIVAESSNQDKKVSEQNIMPNGGANKPSKTQKRFDQRATHVISLVETVKTTEKHKHETSNVLENNVGPEESLKTFKNDSDSNMKRPSPVSQPSTSTEIISDDIVPINVWVEDKKAARGPIRLRISRKATVADLRRQAERSLGLVTHLQRWIVGRTLCTDDATMVVSLAGPDLKAPFYLCLVQSEESEKAEKNDTNVENNGKTVTRVNGNNEFYSELMKLEQQSLVPNVEPFECGVCMEECAAGAGVVLRECIHTFCRECLSDVVQHCQEPVVSCPAMGCSGVIQEREIRKIVSPEEYERWLARSLATAECGTRNTFHCRTPDCTGWAFCDPGVRRFPCPVCMHTNCVQCQAIHENETCEEYQVKLREAVTAAETYKDDEGTQALLNSLISRGEALECPECKAIITKKWGCDWVKCSACKTEICWVTKGRRWGPGGRGDTSGGCRCGVEGQRCHPACGYCH